MATALGIQGSARVANPDSNAGYKEYVPVNAEHERQIAAGQATAENGYRAPGMFGGKGSRVTVRFNCTYDVTAPDGSTSQVRAGHERTFKPSKETMGDRACEGIRFRNPTFEEEAIAMGPRGSKVYPRFLGWSSFPASRLQPENPRTFSGVRVGGR